jgi:hypothetical protein
MKKYRKFAAALLFSAAMAFSAAACAPSSNNLAQSEAQSAVDSNSTQPVTTPDGETVESVDGAAEKMSMTDNTDDPDDGAMVFVYSVKDDKSGLSRDSDTVVGATDNFTAQQLIDVMIKDNCINSGVTVKDFKNENGALTLSLTGLENADNKQVQAAIANTFIQNFENAGTLTLISDGKTVGQKLEFVKDYKNYQG